MPKRSHEEALHDEGFVKFLAQSNRSELVPLYMDNPDSAVRRMRDVFLTPVWWSMQEYKNTEEHRERLKEAIENSRVTRYRISQETGIEESALSRFMSGKRGLSMESIDQLLEYLNLEVVEKSKRRK
jgi:hypothetical protein